MKSTRRFALLATLLVLSGVSTDALLRLAAGPVDPREVTSETSEPETGAASAPFTPLDADTLSEDVLASTPTPFYRYEVIAREGEGNLGLLPWPSVNDNGQVAYIGDVAPRGSITARSLFTVDPLGNTEELTPLVIEGGLVVEATPPGLDFGAELNDRGDVAAYSAYALYDTEAGARRLHQHVSHLIRPPEPDGVFHWARAVGNVLPPESVQGPVDDRMHMLVGPWVSMNDEGELAFLAADGDSMSTTVPVADELRELVAERIVLVSAPDIDGPELLDGYREVVLGTGATFDITETMAPSIANDGRIAVRAGIEEDSPLEVFASDLGRSERIAGSEIGFVRIGGFPAISEDGKAVAFLGDRGDGSGLFLSIDDGEGYAASSLLHRVAGENASDPRPELGYAPYQTTADPAGDALDELPPLYFEDFDFQKRLGVIHVERGKPGFADDSVVIAFVGRPSAASRPNPSLPGSSLLFTGSPGLWTLRVDFEELPESGVLSPHSRSALPVAQTGDLIEGRTIQSVGIYDPIARVMFDEDGAARIFQGRGDHRLVFHAQTSTGAILVRATQMDTDQDGLLDHWETTGIDMDGDGTTDLDLGALGANPRHKDIFLEIDGLVPDDGPDEASRNELQPGVTDRLVRMFAEAPVENPDGSPGIMLHVDAGTGEDPLYGRPLSQNLPDDSLQGGDRLHPEGLPSVHLDVVSETGGYHPPAGVSWGRFIDLKRRFFGSVDKQARELAYHYSVIADFLGVIVGGDRKPLFGKILTAGDSTITVSGIDPSSIHGRFIVITSGRGLGQIRSAFQRTTVFDVDPPWRVVPAPGDSFAVLDADGGTGEEAFLFDESTLPGNDHIAAFGAMVASNGILGSSFDQWTTLAHELGHNLTLQHCGDSPDDSDCDDVRGGVLLLPAEARVAPVVSEGGRIERFDLLLTARPDAPVRVEIFSVVDQIEAIPSVVTFSPADWNVPRRIEGRAIDDAVVDPALPEGGPWTTDSWHLEMTSDDLRFVRSLEIGPVLVFDNERPGMIALAGPGNQLDVVEGGRGDSYNILLTKAPVGLVEVRLVVPSPLSVSPDVVMFSPADWNVPRTIVLSASTDGVATPGFPVVSHVFSGDPEYHGLKIEESIDYVDRESPQVVLTESDDHTSVVEGGAADTFILELLRQPASDVTVRLTPTSELEVSPEAVTFGASSWEVPYLITVSAVDDTHVAEGREVRAISMETESDDSEFHQLVSDVRVDVFDNDFELERDHRSVMSYAHLAPETTVNDYAGPGDPRIDEWTRLGADFFSAFTHIGEFPADYAPSLDISRERYEQLFGHTPDVGAPELRILAPTSGLQVPQSSSLRLRLFAEDPESAMEGVLILVDSDGDGTTGLDEVVETRRVGSNLYEADIAASLLGPGAPRARVVGTDVAGNYQVVELGIDVVPDPENQPPVAQGAFVTTGVNAPVAITIDATDANGSPLSFAIAGPPSNGTLSGAPPQVVYTPAPDFSGFDVFGFRANDGLADSNVATVTVMVGSVNQPPALTPVAPVALSEGTTRVLPVSATDPDGDLISLTASGLPGFAVFENQGGGSATLTLSPALADVGQYTVEIHATDGRFDSLAVVPVTVVPLNDAPVLLPIGTRTALEGFTLAFRVAATDADGDTLAFSSSALPDFATFTDEANGRAVFVVEPRPFEDVGEYPVTVTVSDGLLQASETFTLEVLGDSGAPEMKSVFPPMDATYLRGLQTVRVRFDNLLDPASVTADAFQLHAAGALVPPLALEQRNFTEVVLTYSPLPVGAYEVVLDAPSIRDPSGNVMGTAPIVATRFTLVDRPRSSPSLFPDRVYEPGGGPTRLLSADIDEDGHLDLVTVASQPSGRSVSILLGNGDGTFADHTVLAGGATDVAVGDVNGDGHLDVVTVTSNGSVGSITTQLGNGDATFAVPIQGPIVLTNPRTVVLGDMDGDDILDAVTSSNVSKGTGDGRFTPVSNRGGAILVDVTGDGNLDAVSFSGAVNVLRGTGTGSLLNPVVYFLSGPPTSVGVGDVNEDGWPDIVGTSSRNVGGEQYWAELLLNIGDGTFAAPVVLDHRTALDLKQEQNLSVSLGDLNGDRYLDVLLPTRIDALGVLMGRGDGTFAPRVDYATGPNLSNFLGLAALGDFDEDGDPDVAVSNSVAGTISLLPANGDGTFPLHPDYDAENNPRSLDSGDVDGDGDIDVAVANHDLSQGLPGSVSLFLGAGDGTFDMSSFFPAGNRPSFVRLRDLNRDNYPEILVTNEVSGTLSVLVGNGDGTFDGSVDHVVGSFPSFIDSGDVNGDGHVDVAVAHQGAVSLLQGHGDGTLTVAGVIGSNGLAVSSIALGDVDGDLDLDGVIKFKNFEMVGVRLGSGDGAFSPTLTTFQTGNRDGAVLLADVDADSDLDIVSGSINAMNGDGKGFVSVHLGNGNGTFATGVHYLAGNRPGSIAIGLIDNDQNLDIVAASQDDDSVSLLLGAGDGTFGNRTTYDVGHLPWGVVLGDLNRDGRLDFVTANANIGRGVPLPGTISPRLQAGAAQSSGLPVADAGADQVVAIGSLVLLDGRASTGPTPGSPLLFEWAQTGGSDVFPTGTSTATASFVPVEVGVYTFELTVTADGVSATDVMTVTVVGNADLSVAASDERTVVLPGESYTRTIRVANLGTLEARGIAISDEMPPHAELLAASDGGALVGQTVRWPLFDLPPQGVVTRTVTLRVASALPAGVATLAHRAVVADDGTSGPDPTPGNNVALDLNEVLAAPDLAIALDDGGPEAIPGETRVYQITVQNLGTQEATGAVVRAEIPAGSSVLSASDGATVSGGLVSWPPYSLPAGAASSRSFSVLLPTVWPPGLESIQSTASVGDGGLNGPDPRPENNAAADVDTVHLPELSVTIDDSSEEVAPGYSITYRIAVANDGRATATGVRLASDRPLHTIFEGASDGGVPAGSQVAWPPFELRAGESATRTLNLRVEDTAPESVESVTTSVSVVDDGSHGPDPITGNNQDSDTDRLSFPTDLQVTQTAAPDPTRVGAELTYVIEVRNQGERSAPEVSVRDVLPALVEPVSVDSSQGACFSGSEVACELGELTSGASASITVVVTPREPGLITNEVTVLGGSFDLDAGNNRSTLATTVTASEAEWTFTDETIRTGLGTPGIKTGGLTWCDFDHDGFLDVLVNAGSASDSGRSYLYFNNADGTFREVTATHASGLARSRAHRSAVCGDVNGDGFVDFLRNEHGRIEIYRNRGPAASPPFSFGTSDLGPSQVITSLHDGMKAEGMGLFDFDRDGDLDAALDNHDYGIDLLKNDGRGVFFLATPEHAPRGLPIEATSGDYLAVADYDGDGFVDILGRKEDQLDLWRNLGNGTFEAEASLDDQAAKENKGGVAFCDFDADGNLDSVWTDAGTSRIWRNQSGVFEPTDEPSSPGVDLGSEDLDGVACGDVDNDGDVDLFLGASSGPSYLFLNETPGPDSPLRFSRDNRAIDVGANSEGVAFADYDADGDLDLLVNVDGASNQLWESHRNDASDDRYLTVRALSCLGSGRYRDDLGATVRLFEEDGVTPVGPLQEVNGGSGHGTQNSAQIHFGLPQGPGRAYVVEARFVDGQIAHRVVVPSTLDGHQLIRIKSCDEADAAPVALDLLLKVGGPLEIELRAYDAEGGPLRYEVVDPPGQGELSGDGRKLTYVPGPGFTGDRFTYRASDGALWSELATVTLVPQMRPFEERASARGLATAGLKEGGLAWCDFNEDGYLDVLVNAEERSHLYFNHRGTFEEVTATRAAGLLEKALPRSTICADVNNDGYVDLARNGFNRIEIYLNRGPGAKPSWSFGKPPHQRPNQVIDKMADGMSTEGMGFLDYDRDGDLDLVVDNHGFGIDLFENNHNGHFQQVTKNGRTLGLPQRAVSGDYLAVADFDVDGAVDVLVRKEGALDLWRNLGDDSFGAEGSFDAEASNSNKGGVSFCDFDSDADFDVLWTDAGVTQIWRNHDGAFLPTGEPSASSGVDLSGEDIDGAACADVDNDGDQDMFLGAAAGSSHLFLNLSKPGMDGPLRFQRSSSLSIGADAEAVAFGDSDGDGDLDLLVNVNGGSNQLWLNSTGGSDFLRVRALRCLGNSRHRDDVGATIRLFEKDGVTPVGPVQEVNGGQGHGSQNPAYVHFGLPRGPAREYVLEVRFVGGRAVRESVRPSDLGPAHLVVVEQDCKGDGKCRKR